MANSEGSSNRKENNYFHYLMNLTNLISPKSLKIRQNLFPEESRDRDNLCGEYDQDAGFESNFFSQVFYTIDNIAKAKNQNYGPII